MSQWAKLLGRVSRGNHFCRKINIKTYMDVSGTLVLIIQISQQTCARVHVVLRSNRGDFCNACDTRPDSVLEENRGDDNGRDDGRIGFSMQRSGAG